MTTPAQPPARRKGKVQPLTIIIVLGVGLAAGAFFLWRQRSSSANAANAAAAAPNNEDVAGQIATLQGEIGDLQSSGAQDEAAEAGTGTTPASGLAAPAGFSVTPHAGGANFGWSAVPGAAAYELQVTGAGGKGTGTSHYDHAGTTTHASVALAGGAYRARVRAGTSTVALTGPWTAYKPFTVKAATAAKPAAPTGPKGPGKASGGSGGGESEAA